MIRLRTLKNARKELGSFTSHKEVMDFAPTSMWEIASRDEDALMANILKIYSHVGDRVIDPFASIDRALIANYMDRYYLGYEISPKAVKDARKKIKNWNHLNEKYSCEIKLADGTYIDEDIDAFNFCFTRPPYWDKEKYESVPGQLSDVESEEEFRALLGLTAINLNQVLKKGAYICIVVADIRREGKLIPIHNHFLEEFGQIFQTHDIIINKNDTVKPTKTNRNLKNRIMDKTHEYILVFRKVK